MIIRPAAVADAAAIARVHVDSWRTTYRGIVPDEVLAALSYEEREGRWVGGLSDRSKFVYVAEDAGSVVGFAAGGPERTQDPLYKAELYTIYLLESHQRRGIGRHLAEILVERFRKEGFSAMLLWVLAADPARKFYEALGGAEIRARKDRVRGVMLDEVAYGWADLGKFGTRQAPFSM